ncbi:MAG: SRPBCC domain-containing protein [Planctomycetes bacterium]|nr:SRPBCC domain-containing protein [Planctomycetota bacterium]
MERVIHFELDIAAGARELWSVLTDAAQISRWWEGVHAVKLSDAKPGGIYTLDYESGEPDVCEILENEPGKRLRYRWQSSEPEPTIVEYRLEPIEGGTRLVFHNTGYKPGEKWDRFYQANFVGWLEMMIGVKKLLEGATGGDLK